MKIGEGEYFAEAENLAGYCKECDEITRHETEPDAEGYKCPACGALAVMGMEQAMLLGHIEFSE